MTLSILSNARVVTPTGITTPGTVSISSGRVESLHPANYASEVDGQAELVDIEGGYLLPGFIDTQVNGGGGVLFNDAPTVETIAAIGEAHAAFGTTGFLPTLISDDLDKVDKAMRAVEQAIEAGIPGVLGIHIEGPFINVARKGIHNPSKFRRLDAESLGMLSSLRRGRTMVTLAPELCEPDDIKTLAEAGVIVSAGHTDGDYATIRRAVEAGLTGFTHLFNAMSPMTHRAPGVVGAALEDQVSYCGIIVDGHHVHPGVLRIALAARPVDRFMLVTDAMPTVGAENKTFELDGQRIVVEDGICLGPDGTLAGSDLDMAQALRNVIEMCGLSLVDAAFIAATAPARFLRLPKTHGCLTPGAAADLVWLDHNLRLRGVWRKGVLFAPTPASAAPLSHRN